MMLKTILKLKRTLSPTTLGPMGWREIGQRIGKTAMGARYLAREAMKKPHCPSCLRSLEREQISEVKSNPK